jgi:hypothetical protein
VVGDSGIEPLTQFDDYSTPMSASFTATPNLSAYTATRPSYDMTTLNTANAPMAAQSAAQNLDAVDQIDEKTFNEAIWESVNGADSPIPAPQHHVFAPAATTQGSGSTGSDGDG